MKHRYPTSTFKVFRAIVLDYLVPKNHIRFFSFAFSLTLMSLMSMPGIAQNVNVNPGGGSYATVKAAFDAINSGTHTGTITVEIVANTTEAASAVLNASGGSSSYTSILIQPSGGSSITVSGNLVNGHLIDLSGADNVTFDGLNTGGNNLTIVNSGTGLSSVVRFIGDASNNFIQNITLQGSSTNASSGVVFFSTGATNGNDGNNINNCNITSAGSNMPINGIYSSGTSATVDNSGNTIHQNNISDYFNAIAASQGINLTATGNTSWTITNNRLFQTVNRIFTANNTHSGVLIGTGSGYTISGNIIGYANSSGTGTTNLAGVNAGTIGGSFPDAYSVVGVTLNATRYIAINCSFTVGGVVSEIQNNTIAGFALLTSSGLNSTTGIWCGINVNSGNANIGTTNGNTIGATSGNGSVYTASSSAGGNIVGIYANTSNTINIQNNLFGALDAMATTNVLSGAFTGIDVTGGGGVFSISNNTIGNSSVNNIRTGNLVTGTDLSNVGVTFQSTTGTSSPMVGIRSSATGNTVTITGNSMQGWATSCTAGAVLTGITTSGALTGTTPAVTVNGNFLGTSSRGWMTYTVSNSGALSGISVTNSGARTYSIQSNDFRGITYSVAGSGTNTYILLTGATAANAMATIASNTFTNLNVNTTGSVTFISQSFSASSTGTKTVNNNSISTSFSKGSANGTITFVLDNGTSASGSLSNCTNNNFSNVTAPGTTQIFGFNYTDGSTGGSPTRTVSGNTFTNWSTGAAQINAMNFNYWNGVSTLSDNTITNLSGQGNVTGLTIGSAFNNATSITIASNTISNLISTGAGGAVNGISCGNFSPGISITNNTIHTFSTTGSSAATGIVNGINITGSSAPTISKNKIYDLSGNHALTTINGINCNTTSTLTISNNLVGDLRAAEATGLNAISGINLSSSGAYNVYFNTIYLNATSSSVSTFGTSCISFASTVFSFNNRNNILVNFSTPAQNGTNTATNGYTACLRRSTGSNGTVPANYAMTSDNNLYWVNPTAGANNHLTYGEGTLTVTNPMNTLVLFQAFLVNRDQLSVEENPTFLSTTGSSASFLHVDPNIATQVDNNATTIGGITDDFDGDVRNVTTPDIGADEIILADCEGAVGGTATVIGPDSFCDFGIPDIQNAGYSEGVGSTYQWMSATGADEYPSGGTPISMQNNPAVLMSDTVSTTTYFWLKVTCTSGIATAYSNMITITIVPAPTATISPSGTVNVCLPNTSQLLTANTGTSNPLFVWKKNGLIMDGATESTCTITEYGSYEVEITDSETLCSTLSEATVVAFDGLPDAGTVLGTTPLCVGVSDTYTTSGNPGGSWSSTNTSVASVNPITGVVLALSTGTTDITYTSTNICGDSDMDSKSLTVNSIEVANTNDNGPGSLREIIACVGSGATITFSNSISGSTILLTGGEIIINKSITLAGPGALSLSVSGNNASRIFHVLAGSTLTIQGMTLKNAAAVTNGGAVWAEGNLTLQGAVLSNNFENGVEKSLTVAGPAILQIIGNVDFKKN